MRFFLLIISLVFSFSVFAVTCTITGGDGSGGGENAVTIVCVPSGIGSGGEGDENVLDKDSCETLKADVASILDTASNACLTALSALHSADSSSARLYNMAETLSLAVSDKRTSLQDISYGDGSDMYVYLNGLVSDIQDECRGIHDQFVGAEGNLQSSLTDLQSQAATLSGYSCSDATCSGGGGGSGTLVCPCQTEFNSILQVVGDIRTSVKLVEPVILTNLPTIVTIDSTLHLLNDTVSNIVNRLNAPDDRMWGELTDIYTNVQNQLSFVTTNSLNLSHIFYQLKNLIQGYGDSALPLSTEGVILLNQLVFDMASYGVGNKTLSDFQQSVVYFSNTVSRYYRLFDNVSRTTGGYPTDLQYKSIQNALTNTSKSAKNRLLILTGGLQGGQTNWFQRMELYQQAQLGWFDTPLEEAQVEREQDSLTESGIEEQARLTTNDLHNVVGAGSSLSNDLSRIVRDGVESISRVEISAVLPTQLTFFPEIELRENVTFGPIVWDTTEFQDTLELIRKCTTLIWRFIFWGTFIAVAYAVARLSFMLVLYIVHIAKDL